MNVAPDQTIIYRGLQIFLDHRSLSSLRSWWWYPPPFPAPPIFSIFSVCHHDHHGHHCHHESGQTGQTKVRQDRQDRQLCRAILQFLECFPLTKPIKKFQWYLVAALKSIDPDKTFCIHKGIFLIVLVRRTCFWPRGGAELCLGK